MCLTAPSLGRLHSLSEDFDEFQADVVNKLVVVEDDGKCGSEEAAKRQADGANIGHRLVHLFAPFLNRVLDVHHHPVIDNLTSWF